MISFFKKFKINKKVKFNRGMTYVELIVVLSIFSIMSSIVLFNYNKFQAKVDIKNLANDIALKIVEAQKSAMSGKLPALSFDPSWKPSYGVYFNTANPKNFIYFTDINNDNFYTDPGCTGECLDNPLINKGNFISSLDLVNPSSDTSRPPTINDLTIDFTRPNSNAVISSAGQKITGIDHVQITVSSPQGIKAYIKVYPSGRVQIN